jgi:hypothetical protein
MGKYRKKPVVIEALQWKGTNIQEMFAFLGHKHDENYFEPTGTSNFYVKHDTMELVIKTLEGNMIAPLDAFIIRGVEGEYYPCQKEIFEKTYEYVTE